MRQFVNSGLDDSLIRIFEYTNERIDEFLRREDFMLKRMKVAGITVDPFSNVPIVILKDLEGKDTIPIWIGLLEASAIATELEDIKMARPMTHDLLKSILDVLHASPAKIVVNDLRDNTYYATIHLDIGDQSYLIDSRPSDAIALALRMNSPIFVDEKVVRKSKKYEWNQEKSLEDEGSEKWTEILENLSPEDFGKYKV